MSQIQTDSGQEHKNKHSALQQLNKNEEEISVFFSALAAQYFLHKDLLTTKMTAPQFIYNHSEYETCASQRAFIKDLLSNPDYRKVVDEFQALFSEYCLELNKKNTPSSIFLSRINKAFLIRQIFGYEESDTKFKFIEEFLGKSTIDFEKLKQKIWQLQVEQQIIVLARIYGSITDNYTTKRKTLLNSYRENLHRLTVDAKQHPNKHSQIYPGNLETLKRSLQDRDNLIHSQTNA